MMLGEPRKSNIGLGDWVSVRGLHQGPQLRTIDGLQNSIGKALDAFSATECANYFRHAGYA